MLQADGKNKLTLFGNTFSGISQEISNKMRILNAYATNPGTNGSLWNNLFPPRENINIDFLSQKMVSFRDEMLATGLSADALSERCLTLDNRILQYAKSTEASNMSVKGFTTFLNQNTIAAKANHAVMSGLSMTGNMLAFAVSKLDDYIHRSEILIQKGQEASQEINQISSALQSHKNTLDNCGSSYSELVSGVDRFTNKNKSLSTDDYQKYLDVTSQLAEAFPELIKGYDATGCLHCLSGREQTVKR